MYTWTGYIHMKIIRFKLNRNNLSIEYSFYIYGMKYKNPKAIQIQLDNISYVSSGVS